MEVDNGMSTQIQPFVHFGIKAWLSYCSDPFDESPLNVQALKEAYGNYETDRCVWQQEIHPLSAAKKTARRIYRRPLENGGQISIAESLTIHCEILETGQKVGFITPLTHNFCESCNRVRMTCTGQLFMCLGQEEDADLRSALRENITDDTLLRKRIMQAIDRKPKGHDFDYSRKKILGQMSRYMSHTGG